MARQGDQRGRGAAARWALAGALLLAGQAQAQRSISVGLQAGGTLSWVTYAIGYFGIDRDLGLKVNAKTYASKDATRVALRSGDAQVVVDDFLEVTLLRQKGFDVTAVYPFSLLTGGVIVPAASDIRTVADLKGKTIGATSLTDKTLLILRAYARARAGFDPQTASQVASVSSPLMEQFMTRGEIQAGIPFWHHGARMVSTGKYRQLISSADLLRGLGLAPNVPLLYLIARNDTDPETLRLFVKAALLAEDRMKRDDGYWDAMLKEGLYNLPDRAQLPALRAQWAAGLPKGWSSADLNNTLLLTRKMIEVAGPDVVGLTRLDTRAFNTRFRP
ncbi:ABC transporter substrate-binding protein [Deinococcus metallilatus]|uniref:NitT/TauT family transport system substrate-binding protein n=1 Tax=Deinococcus metallilatus TaxID=1211322 RepID=A0ABR6MRD9_9DEIO|nr:ABC transporter substrate-binding protein [Deinococcus metallilatus]MBB5294499.1 NitT/TauT family transport system substrate-binding protein [Deinococcus metallilatus]GMA15714.1 ABC transporter substrate-binding protein [Deinococcus metallilatus]